MINWRYKIQHAHCTYHVQTSTKVVGPGIEQPRVRIASVCSKPNYCQAFQQRGRVLNCCACSSHSCCLSHHFTPPTVTQLSTLTAVDQATADNISNNAQEWQEQTFWLWQLWATGWHLSNGHRSSTASRTFLLAELCLTGETHEQKWSYELIQSRGAKQLQWLTDSYTTCDTPM
jgi:hypothetical protein